MKKRKMIVLIAFLSIISGLWSCQWHTIEPTEIVTPDVISFATDLEPVFDSKCGSCHSSGSKNFTTGNAYESLINGNFTDTLNPESSVIYTIMKDERHPSESGTFSDTELALLLSWIEAGANDN